MTPKKEDKGFWETIQEKLKADGLDMETLFCGPAVGALKFVCVPSSLRDSVDEMSEAPRDQVIMVRVDGETASTLDSWLETDAVKSRSEAAAVFIREGLKVRAQELQELQDALSDVKAAKSRLREKARQVLGRDDEPAETDEEKEDQDES